MATGTFESTDNYTVKQAARRSSKGKFGEIGSIDNFKFIESAGWVENATYSDQEIIAALKQTSHVHSGLINKTLEAYKRAKLEMLLIGESRNSKVIVLVNTLCSEHAMSIQNYG